MAQSKLTMRIEFSWWLKLYLRSLILFCKMLNVTPDYDKLANIIRKGCKIKCRQSNQS
jgi:hypothetical protein